MTSGYSNLDQVQENFQRIEGQLDALVDITGQTKHIANNMNSEIEAQNRMLGGMSMHMDATQQGVDKANEAVLKVKMTAGNCMPWLISVLLVLAIVILPIAWKP
jgi:pyruvate-formate lyase